jgi:hypothetical protein
MVTPGEIVQNERFLRLNSARTRRRFADKKVNHTGDDEDNARANNEIGQMHLVHFLISLPA